MPSHSHPSRARARGAAGPLLGVVLLLGLGILPRPSEAQYFGRNKIQYRDFDFKVIHTPHFDIYYYPEEKEAADLSARMAERWYARHALLLADSLRGVQPIILYASFPQFAETNVVQGIGEGTGGVTEPALRRVVLACAGPLGETNHVIGHELVHAFQYDITGRGRGASRGMPSAERLPLWFIEGMAEYLSLGPDDPNTAMWMRDAALKKLPSVSDLANSSKYFPYRYGQALLAYIGGRWGDEKLGEMLRAGGATGSMSKAIDSVLAVTPDSLTKAWHAALHAQYDSLAKRTHRPSDYGRRLIEGKAGGEDLNVSPVVSPDGSKLVFFSSRDMFSIDLFLADANTGKVEKNLLKTELDPHLAGLEFIESAGSWDPDGRRFVFSAVQEDHPVLEILDVARDRVEQEIPFPELGEILNPAWSPDGRTIAFSAIAGGLTDLFLYDLDARHLRRLTDDPYADLQPAWSPDGRTIAFATDRYTTDLSALRFGSYGLATLDVASGRIDHLPGFDGANNLNPQFSADGASLYWISDRGGVTNIYRRERASGAVTQVTDLYGGVSGITSLSPALSVATKSDRVVYSDFEEGRYHIWDLDPKKLAQAPSPVPSEPGAAVLPPPKRASDTLVKNLRDPSFGLPADSAHYIVSSYHPSLRLVGAGQAAVGADTHPFGTDVGGALALEWSDMLGNRNLVTSLGIQSGSGSTDVTGLLGYANTGHRFYWGGELDQVPYVYGGTATGYATVNGQAAYVEQDYLFGQVDREATGSVSYPFRSVLRVDLGAGYRNTSFHQELDTRAVALNTGEMILDQHQNLPAPSALNLGLLSTALVYDNSVMGPTSPILGRRWRVEASPTVGSLTWVDALADLRQYLMPVRPVTLAARLLHYGRYGGASENVYLSPLYLGYPGLVRGYGQGLFGGGEQPAAFTDSSTVHDPLYGSRILVGNVEARAPLFGLLGLGTGYYGFFPIEVGTFYDSGVAWWRDEKPWFLGGPRRLISSYGGLMRINILGYAVGELDYVKLLSGSNRKWGWQFNLVEGF